jgi:hypothetical protein
MYQELLKDAKKLMVSCGRHPQPPCSGPAVERLRARAHAELGAAIPDAYAAFLELTNGFEWNGLVVYASETTPMTGYADRFIQGLVEANGIWREYEPHRELLIFGDGDISLYAFNIRLSEYQILDRQSDTLLSVVGSFEALVARALEDHRFTEDE